MSKIKASYSFLLFHLLSKGIRSNEERKFEVEDACITFDGFRGVISDEDYNYEIIIKPVLKTGVIGE